MKCFLTAASGVDTSMIREILESNNVSVRDAFDFEVGEKIAAGVVQHIRRSSFVVAVITEASANVFMEIGLAQGMGRPLLILGQSDEALPLLQAHPHLRASGDDRELLEIVIGQFIEEVRTGKARSRRPVYPHKPSMPSQHAIQEYLDRVNAIRSSSTPAAFEQFVADVLKALGTGAVRNEFRTSPDRGVDFALWNDRLTPTLGNPLLIDLKHGVLSPERLNEAETALRQAAAKTGARAALLFYLDRGGKRFPSKHRGEPWIMRWDFEEFLHELTHRSFEEAILAKRNKMAHGVES